MAGLSDISLGSGVLSSRESEDKVAEVSENNESAGVRISLEWPETIDLPTVYVNHVYVQHSQNEFYLIFGESEMPVLTGTPDERRDKIENLESIAVRPLVKLAISPPAMFKIAGVIRDNVDRFLEKVEHLKPDNGDNQ